VDASGVKLDENSTYSVFSRSVSTVKKSEARMPAKLAELALDPDVPPARVLPGEPHDDLAELGVDWMAPDLGTPVRPLAPHDSRCQRSTVWGVTRNDLQRSRGRIRAAAARNARSIGRND
jgi:hypothetical protein